MIVFVFPYVIPVYSLSLTKGYFKTGVYRWKYIVILLLLRRSAMFFVSLFRFSIEKRVLSIIA